MSRKTIVYYKIMHALVQTHYNLHKFIVQVCSPLYWLDKKLKN